MAAVSRSAASAARISLFDDELESITLFDPLTGQVHGKVGRFTVFPSSHYVTPRPTLNQAVRDIKAELKQRLDELTAEGKLGEAGPKLEHLKSTLEKLKPNPK